MLPQAARDHYLTQQRLLTATLSLVRREWSGMGDDFDASWARVGPRVALLTASAQVGAARNGAAYVPATLAELGQRVTPDGAVSPRAMVGAQSLDGLTYGSLDALLYGAVIHAKRADVESLPERLYAGGSRLQTLVHTQVSDAAKQSASVAITARPGVGYVRAVSAPCCQRCAVLAGRFYRVGSFARHPRCDCYQVPTTVAPLDGFGQSVEAGDVKDLTRAQRQAVDDGADLNQVINAHRVGARSKDGMTTSEGRGRHGLAGQRLDKGQSRLTPEGIYKVSTTREETLERLYADGYLL